MAVNKMKSKTQRNSNEEVSKQETTTARSRNQKVVDGYRDADEYPKRKQYHSYSNDDPGGGGQA